jgi:hypothetical protein
MHYVTLGGAAAGFGILVMAAIRWWFREKHKPAAAVPFLLALAYGTLLILSGGGLLGGLAGITLWGGNGLGDLALVYGVGGTTANVTRARQLVLTPGGHVVVLLFTLALIGLWKWAGKVPNGKIAAGIIAGVLLGLSGTYAGAAAVPLGSGADMLGLAFTRMIG